MVQLRYTKSSSHYLSSNSDYFSGNSALLDEAVGQNELYARQPRRLSCKICQKGLPLAVDLSQHGVDYVFCTSCTHLNGVYDDTEDFVQSLYIADEGGEYGAHIMDPAFADRTANVYTPKAEFLLSSLSGEPVSLLDVGCGSGHFVYALLEAGAAAKGIDIGKAVIEFGNAQIEHQLEQRPLELVDEAGFFDAVARTDANVVSAVGVIEHLREPQKFFEAFRASSAKYVFYSVPMFSMSALFENAFPRIFPRQLSGGHTHLFTERSIVRLNELIGVTSVAEWRFGTDMMDLYRMMSIVLRANGASAVVQEYLQTGFGARLDELQAVFDRNHFCSEIHLVATKA